MIGKIKGEVTEKLPGAVLLEAGPIEYEINLSLPDWHEAKAGASTTYYIYENIKEDAYNLFGFSTFEAKELFMKLVSVSGVGPKSAMSVMSAGTPEKIKQAVASGNAELFAGTVGVGKKTAERIVVELKSKVAPGASAVPADGTYQALVGLGYSPAQAAEAITGLPESVTDEKERITLALRSLAK